MTSLSCTVCSLTFENKKEQFNHNGTMLHHMVLAEKSEGKASHTCSICNVTANSYKNYLEHVEGQKHKKNFKQRSIELIRSNTNFDSSQKLKKVKRSLFKNTFVQNSDSSKQCEQMTIDSANSNLDKRIKNKNDDTSNGKSILNGTSNFYVLDTRKEIVMDQNHYNAYSHQNWPNTQSYQNRPNAYPHQNRSYQGNNYYNQRYYQPYHNSYRGYHNEHRFGHNEENRKRDRYFNAIRRQHYDDTRPSNEKYNRDSGRLSKNQNLEDIETRQDLSKPSSSVINCISSMGNNNTQNEISNDHEKSIVFSGNKTSKILIQKERPNMGPKNVSKVSASTGTPNKNTAIQPSSTNKSKDILGRPIVKPVTSHLKYLIGKTSRPLPIRRISSNANDNKLKHMSKKVPRSRSLSSEGSSNEVGLSSDNKLIEWSNGLQKVWPTMSSCDTDLINHLVNFPCSNKDRAALTYLIKEHSKSKKKLSYPRFNLPHANLNVAKKTFDGSYESMEKAVSDVINVLPENVLNSLVSALDSDKEDQIDKSTSSGSVQSETFPNFSNYTNFKNMSNSVCNVNNSLTTNSTEICDSVISNKRSRKTSQATKSPKKKKTEPFRILEKNNTNVYSRKSTSCSEDFTSNKDQTSVTQPSIEISQADLCDIQLKQEKMDEYSEINEETRNHPPSISSPLSSLTNSSSNQSQTSTNNMGTASSTQSSLSNAQLDTNKLLDLLAKGSVTVKSEFEDPIIETMKTFGSNIWDQVTTEETPVTPTGHSTSLPRANSSSTIPAEIGTKEQIPNSSVSAETGKGQIPNSSVSAETGKGQIPNSSISVSIPAETDTTEHVTNPSASIPAQVDTKEGVLNPSVLIPAQADTTESMHSNPSISERADCNEAYQVNNGTSMKSDSAVLQSKIKELVEMNLEEEKLHKEFKETEHEICHLQEVLNNWIAKKNEIHQKIITLGTKRLCILQQLQVAEDPKSNFENKQAESPIISHQIMELMKSPKKEMGTASSQLSDNVLFQNAPNSTPSATPAKNKSSDDESVFIVSPVKPITTVPLIDIEDSSEEEDTKVIHLNDVKNQPNISLNERLCVNVDQLTAHKSTITFITISEGFLYTSSNDSSARRFSLENPSDTVEYKGHTKSVTSLSVSNTIGHHTLFTACFDGRLRSFQADDGECLFTVDMKSSILCMCKKWGKLFVGLHNGEVVISETTNGEIQSTFQCAKSSINRIATATQGALRLLCIIAYDGVVTIWDASSSLLLRCLEGRVKPPSCTQIFDNSIYISSTEKSLFIQDISSGKLQKMLSWPATTTGLAVCEKYIISSAFDGVIRCYDKKNDFSLHCLYYGAGNEMVTCMTIYKDWIFTGNRKGLVEAVKFNPDSLESCQFGRCHFKFGRKKDLMYHAAVEHIRNMDKQCRICPWRSCSFSFNGACTKVKEGHIMGHFST